MADISDFQEEFRRFYKLCKAKGRDRQDMFCSCYLRIEKKRFFYWLKQLVKQTTIRQYDNTILSLTWKLHTVEMSHWYQMDPKVFL